MQKTFSKIRPEFVDILIFPFYNCKSCPQSKVNLSKGFYTPVHILKIHLQIKKKTLPWSFGRTGQKSKVSTRVYQCPCQGSIEKLHNSKASPQDQR